MSVDLLRSYFFSDLTATRLLLLNLIVLILLSKPKKNYQNRKQAARIHKYKEEVYSFACVVLITLMRNENEDVFHLVCTI
jgi:hypothetical protein